jgi:hypothetical protein
MVEQARCRNETDSGGDGDQLRSVRRTRSQSIQNAASTNAKPALSNDFAERIGSEEATKRPETTHSGHGVQNEKGVVPMSDVHAAAAALLHRVADGGEIPVEVSHGLAELVLRSELVAGSRQVLDAPPELAARRAVELASVVLAFGARADVEEEGKDPK